MKLLRTAAMALTLIGPLAVEVAAATETATQDLQISRQGSRTITAGPDEFFTGSVRVEMLLTADENIRASAGYVTFSPGARTAWHTHPRGQKLIVTAGVGLVQRWNGPIEVIRPGDVVLIPPGVKHWHGAAPDSSMTHLAIQEHQDGKTAEWLEKVSDEQYQPHAPKSPEAAVAQPSRAQQLMGDIAPKLADLTDTVLFGDVWARPGLSPRDRSLVTVSALVAMNRPDQLRSHLALGRKNGLTQDEIVEAITHLAFYSGWPNAVTAVGVARDVFGTPR